MTGKVSLATMSLAVIAIVVGCAPPEPPAALQEIEQRGAAVQEGLQRKGEQVEAEAKAAEAAVRDRAADAEEQVRGRAADAKEQVRERADRVKETASQFAVVDAVRIALRTAGVSEASGVDIQVSGSDSQVVLKGIVPDANMREKAQVAARGALDSIGSKASIVNKLQVR